jgi:hypothetical protein
MAESSKASRDIAPVMLGEVISTLQKYGRPRKNPGMNRPVAVSTDNMVLDKVTAKHLGNIKKLSLPGAFRYVELTGGYGKIPSEKAKSAFYEAHTGINGFSGGILDDQIQQIDQDTADIRLILRSLRAARKKLRKTENHQTVS